MWINVNENKVLSGHMSFFRAATISTSEIQEIVTESSQYQNPRLDDFPLRVIPSWWKFVPFLLTSMASTVYPNLYFPADVYADIHQDQPDPESYAIFVHEQVHLVRMRSHPLRWNARYLLSPTFRLKEEITAIAVEMHYRKQNGLAYNFHRKTAHFSSSAYGWMTTYDVGMDLLKRLWELV